MEMKSKDEPFNKKTINHMLELNENNVNHDAGEMKVRNIVYFKVVS